MIFSGPQYKSSYSSRRARTPYQEKRASWERYAAYILIFAAIIAGGATYAAMAEMLPFENNSNLIIWLLNIDLVILLMLLALTASRVMTLWFNRRKGVAGSMLQTRLVMTFALMAAVPAIIMTVFSAYFFHYGIQSWFSERVQTAVNESQLVAESYLKEHQAVIRADILAMAQDLNVNAEKLKENPQGFERYMQTQIQFRNFTEAIVFNKGQQVYIQAGPEGLPVNLSPEEVLSEAERGKVVLVRTPNEDRVRALVELEGFDNSYLYVARAADPTVLARVNMTRAAAERYRDLQQNYSDLQIKSLFLFIVVATALLLGAIWSGLAIAQQMTEPVTTLIQATDRVRSGDMTVRVPEFQSLDELDYLARAFNRMTSQIAAQRDELMGANRQLDQRRRFTEAILAGVSVGVIAVNKEQIVTIANQPAANLFFSSKEAGDGKNMVGRRIGDIIPGVPDLLEQAIQRPQHVSQYELPYIRDTHESLTLLVRITFENVGDDDIRAVITFDDITALQNAQRKAAWSDVARRIAHEIKNPLTPIQLAAERLQMRFQPQIKDNKEIFEQCIETITRQVGDIGRMVGEFSSFARMPEPVFRQEKLLRLLEDTIFLHKEAHPHINFEMDIPKNLDKKSLVISCDAQQVRQVLTNLVQNSIDAIEGADHQNEGHLAFYIREEEHNFLVTIHDNGPGFGMGIDIMKLTEPYVTFKEKGTGLGLAIAKKIMEDHGGYLRIERAQDAMRKHIDMNDMGGAFITLSFPKQLLENRASVIEKTHEVHNS